MKNNKKLFCLALLLIPACQNEAPDESLDNNSHITLAVNEEAKEKGFARTDKSQSPVKLGEDPTERKEGDAQFWEGPSGSFVKNVHTGFSGANTIDKKVRDAPPFGKSLKDHNSFVLEKYLESGLPSEQVHKVDGIVETMETGDINKIEDKKVTGYVSFIRRNIDDIPVPDSVVMAKYNDKKECVIEMVYWPEIPSAVVEEAKAMKSEKQLNKIKSMVPEKVLKEKKKDLVAIHHKFGTSKGDFEAWASYDVTTSEGGMHSFDFDGKKIKKDMYK